MLETPAKQGLAVYLIDWLPLTRADNWRGFAAYVHSDLANAVRAIQIREDIERISLPLDMGARQLTINVLAEKVSPETANLIASIYGHCPAWFIKAGLDAVASVHHLEYISDSSPPLSQDRKFRRSPLFRHIFRVNNGLLGVSFSRVVRFVSKAQPEQDRRHGK